jgi:L-iditol 2-dehydrogenase
VRAVLQHGVRDIRVGELPDPRPAPGQALLRTRAVTICASDIHLFAEGNVGGVSWDRPFVPGHEVSATVEDPNGTALAPGTPVVLDPALPCRACDRCAAGRFHLCRYLGFMDLPPVDGAMRELIAWPADRVFPIPENVDIIEAPLIEPLCIAVHATELAPSLAGATVAVVGCGAIGLLTVQMARLRGAARVLATDLLPERLSLAREFGAEVAVQVGPEDPTAAILDFTQGRGVDVTFEAAGPPEAVQQALDVVRPGGEVLVIGIPSEDEYRLRASQLRRNEITLRFVRRQNENYPEAIELVRQGRLRLSPLLTHRFPMDRAQEAFDLAERKAEDAVRVAVVFG